MIVFAKKGVRIAEVWFDEEPNEKGVDVVRRIQRPTPFPNCMCDIFTTMLLDLRLSEDELASGMKKDARYAIRRAEEKDNLKWQCPDAADDTLLLRFSDLYNNHASRKGLRLLDRSAIDKLKLYAARRLFHLTEVQGPNGTSLTWHAYILSPTDVQSDRRARLLYSLSSLQGGEDTALKQLVGRANRYHHWRDILRFRREGCTYYDFGGWYAGKDDQEKLKINKFKEEFGGILATDYDCEHPVSLKGRLYLCVRYLLRRIPK